MVEMRAMMARTGALVPQLKTPCYIPTTILGSVPHLTPDNQKKLPALQAQTIAFADMLTCAETVKSKGLRFREFINTNDLQLLLTARDYGATTHVPSTKNKFVVETQGGRRVVSVQEFVDLVQLLKPEVVVAMADEVNSSFAPNRQRAAVQSSLDWLDACIAAGLNTPPSPSSPSATSSNPASLLCGVIVGGNEERLRRLSTVETCKRNVQAVLISGLDSCENETTRNEMLEVVVNEITPSTLPRLLSGIGHPLQVVNAVGRGIDAFVSPYPATVTKKGSAMIFWIDSGVDDTRERTNERKLSGSVLHLREPRFAKDTKPLMADCKCFACQQKYSRAYIHHLLNVREMLGDVLLYMHNMHHYYRFFATMRQTIDAGAFESFAQVFTSQYEEKESTAPPLAIPLAILERRQQLDEDKKAALAARKAKSGKKGAKEKASDTTKHE